MTHRHRFRILNVFTLGEDRFTGNPLCVFEDARGLSDEQMASLALQMNLSETTFVLPAQHGGAARVRIFTPAFELPFAGHPSLGTAHVVAELTGARDAVTLEMQAGDVEVTRAGRAYTLRAARAPETRAPDASPSKLATMLGLPESAIAGAPLWVDTGTEQLVVPLRAERDVRAVRPDPRLLATYGFSQKRGASMVYAFARTGDTRAHARFFSMHVSGSSGSSAGDSVIEDPATGSACANLGGFLLANGHALPVSLEISQGEVVKRPSRLLLTVDASRDIFVGGDVLELGRGELEI